MIVIKTKSHDVKLVQKLAETIKTLLDKNISGEGWRMMKAVNKVKCEMCGKFYSSERYLKSHTTKMHGVEKASNVVKVCTNCNKKFLTAWNLKSHLILCNQDLKISKKWKPISENETKILQTEPTVTNDVKEIKCQVCYNTFESESEKNSMRLRDSLRLKWPLAQF